MTTIGCIWRPLSAKKTPSYRYRHFHDDHIRFIMEVPLPIRRCFESNRGADFELTRTSPTSRSQASSRASFVSVLAKKKIPCYKKFHYELKSVFCKCFGGKKIPCYKKFHCRWFWKAATNSADPTWYISWVANKLLWGRFNVHVLLPV